MRAEEELYESLAAEITPDHRERILALLVMTEGEKITPFQQLLQTAVRPSPDALVRELDRLDRVRALIPATLDFSHLPQPLVERWARLTSGLPTRSLQRFQESNLIILYLLLLKASATSFSDLGSLPIIRQDLVVSRQVIDDRQLNAAVAVGRVTPGPAGLYLVSVGYFTAGVPGAMAGLLALITPSLSVILCFLSFDPLRDIY